MSGNKDNRWMAKAGMATSIPGILGFSILLGYLAGSALDRRFHSDPWLMLLCVLFGIAAGFYEVIKLVIRLTK